MAFLLDLAALLSLLAGVISTAWNLWRWYKSAEGQALLATLEV